MLKRTALCLSRIHAISTVLVCVLLGMSACLHSPAPTHTPCTALSPNLPPAKCKPTTFVCFLHQNPIAGAMVVGLFCQCDCQKKRSIIRQRKKCSAEGFAHPSIVFETVAWPFWGVVVPTHRPPRKPTAATLPPTCSYRADQDMAMSA